MTACIIDGCTRPIKARSWCWGHYLRWYRYGDPLALKPRKSLRERLVEKFTVNDDGCWVWHGALDAGGYGHVTDNGRHKQAHRALYEIDRGPIPPGLDLDHLCRVRRCVNPDHLEPVTRSENLRRGYAARRAS